MTNSYFRLLQHNYYLYCVVTGPPESQYGAGNREALVWNTSLSSFRTILERSLRVQSSAANRNSHCSAVPPFHNTIIIIIEEGRKGSF